MKIEEKEIIVGQFLNKVVRGRDLLKLYEVLEDILYSELRQEGISSDIKIHLLQE